MTADPDGRSEFAWLSALVATALTLAVSLVLSGCGTDSEEASVETDDAAGAGTGYRFTLDRVPQDSDFGGPSTHIEGSYDPRTGQGEYVESVSNNTTEMVVVVADGTAYIDIASFADESDQADADLGPCSGRRWATNPAPAGGGTELDVAVLQDIVAGGSTDVESVGTETIDGRETRRYSVSTELPLVDPLEFTDAVSDRQVVRLDAWTDPGGRIVRVEWITETTLTPTPYDPPGLHDQPAVETMTLLLSDFGVEADVVEPEPSGTCDFLDFLGDPLADL